MADNSAQNATDVIATDDVATLNGVGSSGVKVQRVKACFGVDGDASDVSNFSPLPVYIRDDDRTFIQLWAIGAAAGATGVETAITLTRSGSPGGTTTTGTSFVITSGKRFRITSITAASRGNATATAQVSAFSIRINTAGAVTTTSAILIAARTATPATALAWDRFQVSLPTEGIEILGNGTIQFGITANAVFTTNAPTWDVTITGYEY